MIIVYADIIVIIGGLINGVIALILGAGPTAYTSLGPLFDQGSLAYGIGNTIELFYLWNLVLIWLGLQVTAGLSKVKAAIPIIVLFIIKAGFLAAIVVLIAKFLPVCLYNNMIELKGGSSESPFYFTPISNTTNRISNSTSCNFKFQ